MKFKPCKGATDSIDSTLLPMAESCLHTTVDDVSVSLAFAKKMMSYEEKESLF